MKQHCNGCVKFEFNDTKSLSMKNGSVSQTKSTHIIKYATLPNYL